jgi:RNA polymerase sigma-70 factor (ECF subfamily)
VKALRGLLCHVGAAGGGVVQPSPAGGIGIAARIAAERRMDLDRALAILKENVRLCIVLSYHEGMTHDEISDFTGIPVGTVKSHIRRGSERLRELLAAYTDAPREETPS